jgi:hypothetical protein
MAHPGSSVGRPRCSQSVDLLTRRQRRKLMLSPEFMANQGNSGSSSYTEPGVVSHFWEAIMFGIASGSANMNRLIAYTKDILNGAIDVLQAPPKFPRLVRSPSRGTAPDRAGSRAEGLCLCSQSRPISACPIVSHSETQSYFASPGHGACSRNV